MEGSERSEKKQACWPYLPEALGLKISHSNELAAMLGTRPGCEPTWRLAAAPHRRCRPVMLA